jgi:hypothetical protein
MKKAAIMTRRRFSRRATLTAFGIASAMVVPMVAQAAPVGIPFTVEFTNATGAVLVRWQDLDNDGGGGAFSLDDAVTTNASDAFDADAGSLYVTLDNGNTFGTYIAPTGGVDRSTANGDVVVEAGGIAMLDNRLRVSMSFRFFKPSNVNGRLIYRRITSIRNNTSGALAPQIQSYTNYGSDGDMTLHQTSTGGTSATATVAADRWSVSSDSATRSDPIVTTVWGGSGKLTPTITVPEGAGMNASGYQDIRFVVTIPGNSTRSIMEFFELTDWGGTGLTHTAAVSRARTNALTYNSYPSAALMAGVNVTTYRNIVNWRSPVAPAAPTVKRVAALSMSAKVSITAPTNTGGMPVTGYQARCVTGSSTKTSSESSSTSPTVKGLTAGVEYKCSARAKNAVGWSKWSAAKAVKPRV